MPEPIISEGIVRFTQALAKDATLRSAFLSLERLPTSLRCTALAEMAARMRANREDPQLVAAVAAMTRPELFNAVRNALRERCGA